MIGTWKSGAEGNVNISSDGSFSSKFYSSNKLIVSYEGIWQVKDGVWITTITKASGTRHYDPVGTVDRMKIIRVDDHELVTDWGHQTNLLSR